MDYIRRCPSPLGEITLASDGSSLTGLWFGGQKYFPCSIAGDTEEKPLPVFDQTERWLRLYFSGRAPDFTPPLKLEAPPFRKSVWEILLTIPFGQTTTYGGIAEMIAKQRGLSRMSAQAVGGAVSRNPISLIVPCHRVVGADGSLTGYAGGIERKQKLLALEGVDTEALFLSRKGTTL